MVDSLWIFLGMEISLCGCLCNELLQGFAREYEYTKKRNNNNNQNTSKKKNETRRNNERKKKKKINWTKRKGYDSYSTVLLFDVHK